MGRVFTDLTGKVFEKLTVIRRSENSPLGAVRWECLCECGRVTVTRASRLQNGETKSCGCTRVFKKMHGMKGLHAYNVWSCMVARCKYTGNPSYSNYGGRGISYPPRWDTFQGFWEEMSTGYSEGLSLDRIDNEASYSKENCRWVSWSVQNLNKRKRKNSSAPYIGVHIRPNGKFGARTEAGGKFQHLGIFSTAIEAATAYDNAVEPLIGNRPNNTPKENK